MLGSIFFSPAAAAAFFATGMISLAPNVLLLLMPRYAAGGGGREASAWLSIGQAVGAGGLMADVFLHTLADEASSKNEASGIFVLMGFVIFFAVDLLVRAVNDTSSSHTHSHDNNTHSDHTTTHENGGKNVSTAETTTKRSIVLLNLTADALHNFTDGLAIGASYSMVDSSSSSATVWSLLASHSRGGFATLSIFFHEVPHELSKYCTMKWRELSVCVRVVLVVALLSSF